MNAIKMLVTASLLFTVSVAAQDDSAPPKKVIHFDVDATDADFGILLLATSDAVCAFADSWILSDATMHLLTKKKGACFVADWELPDACLNDVYWQAATFDAARGLRIRPAQKLDADIIDPKNDADADAVADVAGASTDDRREPIAVGPDLPILLKLATIDDAGNRVLHARFTAPSDGYGLVLVRVDSADSGDADVYLYRKLPGKGEGLRDVVEEHSVAVDVFAPGFVRVFLAQGTDTRPGATSAWKLLARLPK